MEANTKKKVIIIVICIALVVLIALSTVLYFVLRKPKDENSGNDATPVSDEKYVPAYDYITNTYNDSIMKKVLTTSNYTGEYELSSIVSVEFNKDLTNDNLMTIYANAGARDLNSFKKYLLDQRLTKKDKFNIMRYVDKGDVVDYGTFVATSYATPTPAYTTSSGSIYGDDNLAVIVFDDKSIDSKFFTGYTGNVLYISLTYKPENSVTTVSDGKPNTPSNMLYIFENVYSKNNHNLRLFTVTYAYKLCPVDSSIPESDLEF